jgi:hypothetical protein
MQGTPIPPDYPPQNAQRGPVGYAGAGGFADRGGFVGPAGPGGPGGPRQNGYPDYGYPATDGYGQTVNGGEYAYVINDDRPGPARPDRPRGPQSPLPTEHRRRTREERMQARPTGTRSITAGQEAAHRAVNPPAAPPVNANANGAYGPDDPAYGPPRPGWSHQDRPVADVRGARQPDAAAEPPGAAAASGANPDQLKADRLKADRLKADRLKADQLKAEHVAHQLKAEQLKAEQVAEQLKAEQIKAEQVANQLRADQLNADHLNADHLNADHLNADHLNAEQDDPSQRDPEPTTPADPPVADHQAVRGPFEPIVDRVSGASSPDQPATDPDGRPYEFPGLADDEPAGSAGAALDRLKELHATAAAVAPQSLDAHFDQLLERQRRLISEYISESEGSSADASGDDSLVGFGGDHRGTR